MNIKIVYPMYILLVYKREISKNDDLKSLLITVIKSLKKIINNNNNNNNNY